MSALDTSALICVSCAFNVTVVREQSKPPDIELSSNFLLKGSSHHVATEGFSQPT